MRRLIFRFSQWALVAAAVEVGIKIVKNQNAIYGLIAAAFFGTLMLMTRARSVQDKNASHNPNEPAEWY